MRVLLRCRDGPLLNSCVASLRYRVGALPYLAHCQTPGQCCNTCEEVQEAYRRKNWVMTDISTIKQCQRSARVLFRVQCLTVRLQIIVVFTTR